MFDAVPSPDAQRLLARLDDVLDELAGLPLDLHGDGEVIGLWRELEARRNRLAGLDHACVSEVRRRHLAFKLGARSTVVLARQVLRIDVRAARARVAAAEALGPRRALTGEALEPIYEQVAAAVARGGLGQAAAAHIVATIDRLPDAITAERGVELERFLVEHGEILDLDHLRRVTTRLIATLDPDGRLHDRAYRERHRDLHLARRADGSGRLEAELTAEGAEYVATMLDTLARPRPAAEGAKDPRSPGQRRHDALIQALKLAVRAGSMPAVGGVAATIVLTMTEAAWRSGIGTATTGHGFTITATEANDWAGGDARVFAAVLTSTRAVAAYSSSHRIFTEGQRLALIARDRGCSFPGCDAAPALCEAHHVTDHALTARTTVDDGTLACTVHHREFARMGWTCQMIDRIPHWTPPAWIDPSRTPRRNHAHHPEHALGALV